MQVPSQIRHIRCIWVENDHIAAETWCLQSACSRRGLPRCAADQRDKRRRGELGAL